MKIASHLEKFDRLAALRARFDPLEDFELWFWTTACAKPVVAVVPNQRQIAKPSSQSSL